MPLIKYNRLQNHNTVIKLKKIYINFITLSRIRSIFKFLQSPLLAFTIFLSQNRIQSKFNIVIGGYTSLVSFSLEYF